MLARFEQLMEGAIEGGLRRVFPRSLQPVQLAKAAARAMDAGRVVGVHGADVPNVYRVRLAPADLDRFRDYRAGLQDDVGRYLADYARERRLRPVADVSVELAGDPALRPGTVRVDARFVDVAPRAAPRPSRSVAATGDGWLVDAAGRSFRLDPANGRVRLGRAADNDVVVPSERVSRYHTELRWHDGAWLVYDLDSTNGTFVDDDPVQSSPLPLPPGATLRLGDAELRHGPANPATP